MHLRSSPLERTLQLYSSANMQAVISKKFIFSVALTEDSFTSRAKRQYKINSIVDRSDRRNFAFNTVTSRTVAQITLPPAMSSTPAGTLLDARKGPQAEPQILSIDSDTCSIN